MSKSDCVTSFAGRFFGYSKPNGIYGDHCKEPVSDLFLDIRQITWLIGTPILCTVLYRYFKNHKEQARKTGVVLSLTLLASRLFVHIISVTNGHRGIWDILPYHLCSISAFAIPLVVLFDIKKLKLPMYTLGIMGGFITIVVAETFIWKFTSLYMLLSVYSHTLLVLIPIIEHARGEFTFDVKKSWSIFVVLIVLIGWAILANKVIFKNQDTNFMFLEYNGLPGDLGGKYYILIYTAIFLIMYLAIFITPIVWRKLGKTTITN